MKKIWDDIKALIQSKIDAIGMWWTNVVLVFLLKIWNVVKGWVIKQWFYIVNYAVIAFAYNDVTGNADVVWADFLLGFWILLSIAYVGYKLFNMKSKK